MFDLFAFDAIDWDDEEDENGNTVHCLRHGVTEEVVYEVLREHPVEIALKVQTAEFAVVGPDRGNRFWTLLFDTSWKRNDWLRPVTGWPAEPEERRQWGKARGPR